MAKVNPEELESRLAGDYQQAQKRVGDFTTAVGIDQPTGERRERLQAKGLRIKGKLIGQKELAEMDLNMNNLISDLSKEVEFTNLQEQSEFKITRMKAYNKFREDLMRSGIMLEAQMKESVLDAETSAKIQEQFTGVAKAAGFAFAMNYNSTPAMGTPQAMNYGATGGQFGDMGTFQTAQGTQVVA